jgi:hypothetical protein
VVSGLEPGCKETAFSAKSLRKIYLELAGQPAGAALASGAMITAVNTGISLNIF